MKKQVTFAESQTVCRIHQHEARPRCAGITGSRKAALKDARINLNNGLKINSRPAVRSGPRLQQVATVQIPKTMSAAPFLKHTALTPAQKEYLHTVAASYSSEHVRNLITQHYMNVLHRCTGAGGSPEGDELVGNSVTSPGTEKSIKTQSKVPSRTKNKEKMNSSAGNPGKSSLPKSPNKEGRRQDEAV